MRSIGFHFVQICRLFLTSPEHVGRNSGHNCNSCCHTNGPSIQFECFIWWNFCRSINSSVSYLSREIKNKIEKNSLNSALQWIFRRQREKNLIKEKERRREWKVNVKRMMHESDDSVLFNVLILFLSLTACIRDKKLHISHTKTHKFNRCFPIYKSLIEWRMQCKHKKAHHSHTLSECQRFSTYWSPNNTLWFKACGNVCTQFSLIILFFWCGNQSFITVLNAVCVYLFDAFNMFVVRSCART